MVWPAGRRRGGRSCAAGVELDRSGGAQCAPRHPRRVPVLPGPSGRSSRGLRVLGGARGAGSSPADGRGGAGLRSRRRARSRPRALRLGRDGRRGARRRCCGGIGAGRALAGLRGAWCHRGRRPGPQGRRAGHGRPGTQPPLRPEPLPGHRPLRGGRRGRRAGAASRAGARRDAGHRLGRARVPLLPRLPAGERRSVGQRGRRDPYRPRSGRRHRAAGDEPLRLRPARPRRRAPRRPGGGARRSTPAAA